jgi:hypothetical protein
MFRRSGGGIGFDQQRDVVALLLAENRLLRARLKAVTPRRRLLLSDEEMRRLGTKGQALSDCRSWERVH